MRGARQLAGQRAGRVTLIAALVMLTTAGCAASERSDASPRPTVGEPITLRTLIDSPAQSPMLNTIEELPTTATHTSAVVSYASDGLTIRGVLRTPVGDGPFPGVVMVHGSIDPDAWSAERVYVAEQMRLVESGYVTLVPDLRNYGESDNDPNWEYALEMGTTVDAINAARALGAEPGVSSVAMIGHSDGGAIALNALVVAPEVATAVVAFAPSNPNPWTNIETFRADTPFFYEVVALRGTPDDNPDFWADVTSTTFADRATAPVLIIQGTADEVVPPAWADQTAAAFRDAGVDVEFLTVNGADHGFQPEPETMWPTVIAFLASHS